VIDLTKVRSERDPGRCYLRAGFRRVGMCPSLDVTGGLLDVAQWSARVERGGNEGVAERVGARPAGDSGSPGDAARGIRYAP
jgi:hypothetical protein